MERVGGRRRLLINKCCLHRQRRRRRWVEEVPRVRLRHHRVRIGHKVTSSSSSTNTLTLEDIVRRLQVSPRRPSRLPNLIRRLAHLRTIRIIPAPWTTTTSISTMA
ncbi:hypothetical protein CPC08DRAFT_265158 [Agrocybe pediades]|nr:hypothetical protein CPC08DRAFT_265158 [Agrocybe pediades]